MADYRDAALDGGIPKTSEEYARRARESLRVAAVRAGDVEGLGEVCRMVGI